MTFQWAPQAAGDSLVSIQEALPTGYQFVGLSCTYTTPDNANPQTLPVTRQGNGLLATTGLALGSPTCEFRNVTAIYKVYLPLIVQQLTPTSTPNADAQRSTRSTYR